MARVELTYPSATSPVDKRDLLAIYGPTIPVDIGFDPNYDPAQPQITPKLAAKGVQALVDTGATMSYIDAELARRLQLIEIDKETVSPVLGGRQEIITYLGQIHIPRLSFTINGHFGGLDLIAGGMHVAAVLGREFLMQCRMTYDGTTGTVVLETT